MRLYAPAKPSSSTGEEDGRRQQQDDSFQQQHQDNNNNKNFHFDSRPAELTRRSIENNDHRPDDKLQINAPRIDDKTQPNHSRLDDKILLNGPLRHDQTPPTNVVDTSTTTTINTNNNNNYNKKKSPSTVSPHRNNAYPGTEVNGLATTTSMTTTSSTVTAQNGPNSLDYTSIPLENGTDSLRSLDSIPWNLEGTETIIENGSKSTIKNWSGTSEEDELKRLREENKKLKAALDEAAEVNGQWRQYHDERQGYVQRLLTTIHELQHAHSSTVPSPRQLDGESGSGGQEGEVRRLRDAMTRLQADHQEHVQLLEMQVRAHRDDWEAERSEKRSAEAALAETEGRAALLMQELQLLQAKLADSEGKRGLCWRCLCPRTDYNNHRSGSNSAPRTPQASPIPAPGGGASPAPVAPSAPPPDNPPPPLKGWIPVSMLHQIAFSGATPEHQTPVVQSQPQQQQPVRNHAPMQPQQLSQNIQNQQQPQPHPPQSIQQQPQQKPYQVSNQQLQQQQVKQQQHLQVQQQQLIRQTQQSQPHKQGVVPSVAKPIPLASSACMRGNEFKHIKSHENNIGRMTNVVGVPDDKKRYEAMGARPKILGNFQSISGKGVGIMEDEKSAKHRARSILASAIPISPVSSGPSTPWGISVTKSSSSSSMPKGYVPITSTVLTPINFRPPFVAHKRPSALKHIAQPKQGSQIQTTSSNTGCISSSAHARSDSSPASLCVSSTTDVNKQPITNQTGSTVKDQNPCVLNKEIACNGKPNQSDNLSPAQSNERKKSPSPGTKKTPTSINSNNNYNKETSTDSLTINKQKDQEFTESISVVTTTTSCSSPLVTTTTASLSNNSNALTTNTKSANSVYPQQCATSTSTATSFPAVTVTTTAAGNHTNSTSTTSSYSSTTSSRSSSPGISLTTFGLNSEGRGIPGAICFALGSDQKVGRSSQACRTSNSSIMSPTPDAVTSNQSQKDVRPPSGVKSPTIIINCAPAPRTVTEEHWWSVESPGRSNKQQNGQSGKLVNSTWVRLMGGQANNRPGSGLPWRTARAVSGQQLIQTRRTSQEENSNGTTSPNSVSSSTATFNYTPAVNSPPSSNLSSATNSAASSPPPNPNQPPCDDLRSMASKNITSAIMSYELNTKCDVIPTPSEVNATQGWAGRGGDNVVNDGIATMTRRDLVCPSCQMLFPPEKHIEFLDHFEICRGPEYADL